MELNPAVDRALSETGLDAVARAADISVQAVSKWRRAGVPPNRVLLLEQLSGVSRSVLRPDLYPMETRSPSRVARRKRA